MKVILSIDAIKFPLTGIGRYTFELAQELEKSSAIEEVKFMSGYKFYPRLPNKNIVPSPGQRQKLKSWLKKSRFFTEFYRLTSSRLKSLVLKKQRDFIYHSPNFYLPAFSGKSIVTFHDLSIFIWPQCHPAERVKFMQKELLLTLKRADALITDSEFTRQELANYFNYPLTKVHAVPLASSGNFYPRSASQLTEVLHNYQLVAGQYVLFTGSIEPRKNIQTLLDAYARLPALLRHKWPLVISGYSGWNSEELHHRIQQGEKEGWLRYLGFTSDDDLPFIFSGARLFVFPSLYEGFGLPVLEAMASGVPVVCSNAASLPEVVGDAALMFEPLDVVALTELLLQGVEDDRWREQSISLGRARSKNFSWQRCAQETINVYEQVEMQQ